jgi:hypothetical protein
MQLSFWRKGTFLVALLLVTGVQSLCAAEVTQIIKDLTPQAGVVVLQTGDEYLIDLDASKGIRAGALVSVLQSGEKIVHPVTQEVIGTLDAVKTILRVTRIKSGYSHAEIISGDKGVAKGDAIRSYSGIPATFRDETGRGEDLYRQLQAGLPELEWRPYALVDQQKSQMPSADSDDSGLIFVLTTQGLDVLDTKLKKIGFYSLASLMIAPPSLPANPAIVKSDLPTSPTGGIVHTKRSAQDGILFGPDMPGLVVGVAVGDFDGDGSREVATAFSHKILFGTVSNGQYQQTGLLETGGSSRLLSIVAVDLDNDGRDELIMTAVSQDTVDDTEHIASLYAETVDGKMQVRQTNIPYLFGSIQLPEEGRILIGQRPGEPGRTYSSSLYRFNKQGGLLVKGDRFSVPTDKATVHGLTITTDGADNPLYVLLDLNERLKVYSVAGDRLWESGEVVGGTEAYFIRRSTEDRMGDSVFDYIKANLDTTADGLVLVPTNEGSTRMFKSREYSKSFLTAYKWDGRSLHEEWKTALQSGSLSGFTYADVDNDGRNELVSALIFNHGSFLNPGSANSTLVIYELP